VHGIVGVLQEVRRGRSAEPVHSISLSHAGPTDEQEPFDKI
jgi:hypothetical protein